MRTTRKLATTALLLAGLGAATSTSTLASFGDQAGIGANGFGTGVIDLGTNPSTALVTYAGMVAGDSVTNDVVVSNVTGSSALRYSVTSAATNDDTKGLKDQLVMAVRTIDATTPISPCDDFDGSQLYSGDLDSSAGKIVGDPAQGFHTGDRPLGVAEGETLCVRVTLPVGTGSAFDLSSTTATFTFSAEQTVHN